MHYITICLFTFLFLFPSSDLRKTALKSTVPDNEIVRLDINNDGQPDIIERWWNGKRVRWLDDTQQKQLEADLARLYYTGQFDAYARLIAQVPGK